MDRQIERWKRGQRPHCEKGRIVLTNRILTKYFKIITQTHARRWGWRERRRYIVRQEREMER